MVMTGCSKSPNEKQMAALEETQKAAVAAEDQMAKLEKENAELKAKLEAKKQELKDVQAEKAKVLTKAGQ
jgi:predicted  nucleic acid-binding Zn-ribbon protein